VGLEPVLGRRRGGGAEDDGDVAAAEDHRARMLELNATAMDPPEAARVFFEQSAKGEFHLLDDEFGGHLTAARADVLTHRRAPALPQY
jgi:hypothetical protein